MQLTDYFVQSWNLSAYRIEISCPPSSSSLAQLLTYSVLLQSVINP